MVCKFENDNGMRALRQVQGPQDSFGGPEPVEGPCHCRMTLFVIVGLDPTIYLYKKFQFLCF